MSRMEVAWKPCLIKSCLAASSMRPFFSSMTSWLSLGMNSTFKKTNARILFLFPFLSSHFFLRVLGRLEAKEEINRDGQDKQDKKRGKGEMVKRGRGKEKGKWLP